MARNVRVSDKDITGRYIKRLITAEAFDLMTTDQRGVCGCCGESPDEKERLSVDHCHKYDQIRGLLCKKCNTGIGLLGDDLDGLLNAIRYIAQSGCTAEFIDTNEDKRRDTDDTGSTDQDNTRER